MSLLSQVATILLNGLQQGAIFALLGIGLTIILGTMKFLNLAHGALYLIGSYAGLFVVREVTLTTGLLNSWGITKLGLGYGFFAAMILVPIFGFVVGLLMERYVADPFYDRPETDQLLVTFGLALIAEEIIKNVIGGNTFQSYPPSTLFGLNVSQPVQIPLVGAFPAWRLAIVLIAGVVIGLTFLAIERTDFGLVVQAGTRDSEMVRLLGIRINRSYSLVFALGAALAAFAGLIGASIQTVSPQIGTTRALVPAFLTIVVGGAGSVRGAIVGGLILGLIASAMTQTYSQWSQIVLYLFVAGMLIFRPQGIFGSVEVGE